MEVRAPLRMMNTSMGCGGGFAESWIYRLRRYGRFDKNGLSIGEQMILGRTGLRRLIYHINATQSVC